MSWGKLQYIRRTDFCSVILMEIRGFFYKLMLGNDRREMILHYALAPP
jgi:hypothetical protein